MHLDLRPQPEPESPTAVDLQVIRGVGQMQGAARSCDRHIGHHVEVRLAGSNDERQEDIVLAFEREDPVRTHRSDRTGVIGDPFRRAFYLQLDPDVEPPSKGL